MALVWVRRRVWLLRRSISTIEVAPPSPMLMTTRWPSGEKRGAKVMPGKVADQLALARLQVHEEHARLVAGVLHEGDFLRASG